MTDYEIANGPDGPMRFEVDRFTINPFADWRFHPNQDAPYAPVSDPTPNPVAGEDARLQQPLNPVSVRMVGRLRFQRGFTYAELCERLIHRAYVAMTPRHTIDP